MIIYFIRHGESVGNREERFRGQYDFELNEAGLQQAEALQKELSTRKLQVIYSSPLKRALQTSEILSRRMIPVKTDDGFTNIHLGSWENQPKAEIRRKYPELWQRWITRPESLDFEGMETLARVQERSFKAFYKLVKAHQTEDFIAIVTHRAVLKPLFAALLGIPEPYFWKIQLDTASYSIAEYNEPRGITFDRDLVQSRSDDVFIRCIFYRPIESNLQ
jgi:broad specificity phosphatase PhoE